MNKERWEYLKKLKPSAPITLWNCGKVIVGNIVMRPGKTYRKSEHGPLIIPQTKKEKKSC